MEELVVLGVVLKVFDFFLYMGYRINLVELVDFVWYVLERRIIVGEFMFLKFKI